MEAALQVGFIGLFLVLGYLRPRAKAEKLLMRETWVNLGTGAGLFALRITLIAVVAQAATWRFVALGDFGGSALLQFAFVFLLTDLWRYWLHRAHHRVPFLWQFHQVHHSSEHLDSTSGLRMHLLDFIQLSLMPVLLFGVIFDATAFHPGVWVALGSIVGFMDAFQHSNLDFELGSPVAKAWDRLLNNPHFHSWHHTRDVMTYGDGNYGQALTIWDRLFGTCVSGPKACRELGLPSEDALELSPLALQLLRKRAEVQSP